MRARSGSLLGVVPQCQLNRQLPILINYNQYYLTHDSIVIWFVFTSEYFECFSIEDAKQKAEHDKMMKEAEERKQEVRRIIAQLRRQFKKLLERNHELPEHLRLGALVGDFLCAEVLCRKKVYIFDVFM